MSVRNNQIKDATIYTEQKNLEMAERLGIDPHYATNDEVALAYQNQLLDAEEQPVPRDNGAKAWSSKPYSFLKEKAAASTVNPSLWMNGKACLASGVFEVLPDKIYQVRGLDLANLTVVRSKTGWIVLDTTSYVEVSRRALELLEEALHEPVRDKIRAVIISHSHSDHYGGIRGIVDETQVGRAADGKIPIYVPAGFDEAVVKENVFAGTAMKRRAQYQFGGSIVPGPKGKISGGLGIAVTPGTQSYLAPTDFITEDCSLLIDGLQVDFQLTPGTEAPAEMNNYFPEYRAFWAAENCTATLHNLYPIRGAKLRDGANWWRFTEAALERYGKRSDIVFQSHHWPHANTPEKPHEVENYLRNTAAIYKYIHDYTLLRANQGKTAKEIAAEIRLPRALEENWYTRPYYGTVEINVREVYEFYLGFYNGNPNDINPLTETEEAKLFVEYVGSEERVLALAEQDFAKGEYRRAAKAAGAVVSANPDHMQARYLAADAFEQLGYQAESSIWRNAYLQGAFELRQEKREKALRQTDRNDLLSGMDTQLLLDYLGIVADGTKLEGEDTQFRLQITDHGADAEEFLVHIYHGTILYYKGKVSHVAHYVRMPEGGLKYIINKNLDEIRESLDTDIYPVLKTLEQSVVYLPDYADFPLAGLKQGK